MWPNVTVPPLPSFRLSALLLYIAQWESLWVYQVYKFHDKGTSPLAKSLVPVSDVPRFSMVCTNSILPTAFSCMNVFSRSSTPYN